MSLSESQAQQIMLVQALEQGRENGGLWSAGDAKEATRATMQRLGDKSPFDQFLARRAEWALALIGKRPGGEKVNLAAPRWPRVVAWVLLVVALVTGYATEHFVAGRELGIFAVPILGLILFNVLVYLLVFYGWISGLLRLGRPSAGLLTDLIGRCWLWPGFDGATGNLRPWMARFQKEWVSRSAALNLSRIKVALHAAAICFALGMLASFFLRGIDKEIVGRWETTFPWVTADRVHSVLSGAMGPGAAILGLEFPGVQRIEALRDKGEPAATWFYLYAGAILSWIVLPRLGLALANRLAIWRLTRAFPLPLNSTYFTTLKAIRRGGKVDALAIPFRYELTPQIKNNLAHLLERVHGLAVDISIQQAVLVGEDTADWKAALGRDDHVSVFVIFNLTATAEPDTYARLLEKILNDVGGRAPVIPMVDTGSYPQQDEERLRQRCIQWCTVLDEVRCEPLFLNLTRSNDDEVLKKSDQPVNREVHKLAPSASAVARDAASAAAPEF